MSPQTPSDVSYSTDTDQRTATNDVTDLFDALANDRRQFVIRAVADAETMIGDLAEGLARAEHDLPADRRVNSALRKRAYVALYQTHLGVLDDLDIVGWDEQSGAVTAGDNHAQALRTLWFVIDEDTSLRQSVRDVVGGEA